MSPAKERSKGATLDEMLVEALARMNLEARDKVLLAFLRSRPGTAKAMLSWWDGEECIPRIPARDRGPIMRKMRSDDASHARAKETEARRLLVEEAERFREDALDKTLLIKACYEDKRRAYADGDRYLEEYYERFVEDHNGLNAFMDLVRRADSQWTKGDRRTAVKVYRALLDVYDADKKGWKLFIDEDDCPDLDIGEVFSEEGRLRERASAPEGGPSGRKAPRRPRS